MRLLIPIVLTLLATLSGCAHLPKIVEVLTDILMVSQDAEQNLDRAEAIADTYFALNPDPERQKDVARVIGAARNGLNAAIRATRGAKHLTQDQVDAAFADFRAAWGELETLLTSIGVLSAQPDGSLMSAAGGATEPTPLPKPLALDIKVEE